MKSQICILILGLTALLRAEAQSVPKTVLYGLSCPGQVHLISSDRQKIDKLGHIQSRFPTLAEETEFHKNRIKQKSGKNAERFEEYLENARTKLIFRDGIVFDPMNLGLPATEHGCDVVPIIVSMNDKFVVSKDAWSKLAAVDLLISQLNIGSETWRTTWADLIPAQTSFFLDDVSAAFTLKQYAIRADELLNMDGISFRGTDYIECVFWTDNIPSKCSPYWGQTNPSLGAKLAGTQEVTFWPNGVIWKAFVAGEVTVPRNLNDSASRVRCRHAVYYDRTGRLTYCLNTFIDEKSNIEILSGVGRDTRTSVVRFVVFDSWTDYNDLEIPSVPSNQIIRDLGDDCQNAPRSSLLVEFHPSGHFKAGMTMNKSTKKYEYLEVDESGKITKLAPYRCPLDEKNHLLGAGDFINNEDKEVVIPLNPTADRYFAEVTPLFAKPGCFSVIKDSQQRVTHVKVGAHCFTFARMLGVGFWR